MASKCGLQATRQRSFFKPEKLVYLMIHHIHIVAHLISLPPIPDVCISR